MFTVEVRVNGVMVAHVYGVNTGEADGDRHIYRYELYETGNALNGISVRSGTVRHRRQDGILALVRGILSPSQPDGRPGGEKAAKGKRGAKAGRCGEA